MKKTRSFIALIGMGLVTGCLLACSSGTSAPSNGLNYKERYLGSGSLHVDFNNKEEEQIYSYYIFNDKLHGEYYYYYDSSSANTVTEYTVSFFYSIAGDAIVCTYDNLTLGDSNTATNTRVQTTWERVFHFFSEDVLVRETYSTYFGNYEVYYNENYAKNLTNFGTI